MKQLTPRLCGEGAGVNFICLTILGKREREKTNLVVSSGEVSGKFATEKICITASDNKMNALTQQPVDEQVPRSDILNLVHKQMRKRAIDAI